MTVFRLQPRAARTESLIMYVVVLLSVGVGLGVGVIPMQPAVSEGTTVGEQLLRLMPAGMYSRLQPGLRNTTAVTVLWDSKLV